MKNLLVGGLLGFGVAVVLMILLTSVPSTPPRPHPVTDYSRFVAQVDEGAVLEVTFSGSRIVGKLKDGRLFESFAPHAQVVPALTDRLLAKGVTVAARPPPEDEVPALANALINWAPFLVVCGSFLLVLWLAIGRPVWALVQQIEAYIKTAQQRPSEPPLSRP